VPGATAVSIIVFGRGLEADPAGFRLTAPSAERVEALVAYVRQNAAAFTAQRGRIVFSGGWAAAAEGLGRPPLQFREGNLMLDRAMAADIGGANLASYADVYSEIESDSTLENALRVKEHRYFDGTAFTARNPLGLVAHREHLARINYLVRKAFGLPGDATVTIAAAGTDARSGGLPESVLLPLSRLAFLGAADDSSLRRRHRMLVAWNHRLRALPQ
jgi:hypothetical protein